MFRNLISAAVLAGMAAGCVAAALQFLFVVPLLLEGELYESGMSRHFVAGAAPQSPRETLGLGNDWARHLMTAGFDIVTYAGFGLILAALMLAARPKGGSGARTGLVWGLVGFIAVQLAPAIGLPPELPGTIGAELAPRQAWWAGTILSSAAGLWLIAFTRGQWPWAGVVLLLLPQVIGAPHTDMYWGVAPPELAAEFATVSLGVAAAGWAVLGGLTGWLLERGAA